MSTPWGCVNARNGDCSAGEQGAAAAAPADDEPDWRLQGPAAKPTRAVFKPGTSTWDTDDAKEADRKLGKHGVAERRAAEAASVARRKDGKPSPAEWWREHYRPRVEESGETTGAAARAMTSTVATVATRNERVRKTVYRSAPPRRLAPADPRGKRFRMMRLQHSCAPTMQRPARVMKVA
jgi:hypothetical protein